jgi:hypothetical protein
LGIKEKRRKKKECISKNGMPANGGIWFFLKCPHPQNSGGNIHKVTCPPITLKNWSKSFTNKSNNRVLESVDQEVLGSHLGSLF